MSEEFQLRIGGLIAGVKVNQTQPDEVVVILKIPGTHKMEALALATKVGEYCECIGFGEFTKCE